LKSGVPFDTVNMGFTGYVCLNVAKLCLSFIQLHELEKNMVDYEVFKNVLQGCVCLPTNPVARLRSTDLAMDRIKQFVIGFNKRFLLKKIDDLLNKLSCGPKGCQFLDDMLNPAKPPNFCPNMALSERSWIKDHTIRIIKRIPGAIEMIHEFIENQR